LIAWIGDIRAAPDEKPPPGIVITLAALEGETSDPALFDVVPN